MNNTGTRSSWVARPRGAAMLVVMSGLVIGVNQANTVMGSTDAVQVRIAKENGDAGQTRASSHSRDEVAEGPVLAPLNSDQHRMWDEPNPLDLSDVCEPATNDPRAKNAQQTPVERKALPQTTKVQVKAIKHHVATTSPITKRSTVAQPAKTATTKQRPRVEPRYVSADAKSLPQTGTDTGWGMTTIGIALASLLGLIGIRRRVIVTRQR